MPEYQNREVFHSEETQEIMGTLPSWIVRWGITLLVVIIGGVVLGCYFIKYPETVAAPIMITTVNPPSDLVSRYDGLIEKIYVENGANVKKGDIIAVIANPADYHVVKMINDSLDNSRHKKSDEFIHETWIDSEYSLGTLQNTYSEFRKQCMDFRQYVNLAEITQKKRLLAEQISKNKEYYVQLKKQRVLLKEDLKYESENLVRDSLLFSKSVITAFDYEKSMRSMIQNKNTLASFDATLINTELTILQNEQQLIELSTQQNSEVSAFERQISKSRQELLSQIQQWTIQYVIESPMDGRVSLAGYWSDNQRVKVGDRIATIIPAGESKIVGRMNIPQAGFGKIKTGQVVNVKLNGYPYMEFGILKGEISSISAVPESVTNFSTQSVSEAYIADVAFPNDLISTYGKDITLIQQMDGSAEIIVLPRRLIHRFIDPIRALFDE